MSNIRIAMNNLTGWAWCEDEDCPVLFFAEDNKVCPGCWKPSGFSAMSLSYVLEEIE